MKDERIERVDKKTSNQSLKPHQDMRISEYNCFWCGFGVRNYRKREKGEGISSLGGKNPIHYIYYTLYTIN